ncbi:uncharacterized protein E0L32_008874 [Thyridium curvatum]|uniref:Zn(2)-C6 fungal-type domain-containing protein n=1 Tax=Thyridium curvatum TaxID=1093900 RepID=A0A507AK19_9PEZI|nr:uncharacterized protein E0L32_008874 [Thyridium curvatum]TPX09852.1 hypothetical protein E0L32_008874 [Thyridium curvatum]
MAKTEPKRQHRLWLSCRGCRARKVKCDRARPCHRCVKVGKAAQCHYDLPTDTDDGTALGQFVFAVQAPERTPNKTRTSAGDTAPQISSISGRNPTATLAGSSSSQATAPEASSTEVGPVGPLQLLWHGSRSVDVYVEPLGGQKDFAPKEVIFGENDGTVYWGRGHETNFVPRITDAARLLLEPDQEDNVATLYQVERSSRPGDTVPIRIHDPELRALLPEREATDRLVDVYVKTFESYYKIIHVPTFRKEYAALWDPDPVVSSSGPPTFLAQLLSVCAIGSGLDGASASQSQTARQWIEAVRLWLFKQDPRTQMTLGHMQAHLLMLVAGDVHWIKIDRSWVSSGMLVRNAISAGLHREPSDFTRVSPFHAELRRRLWYSILEFDLQACFAKGRTPLVRKDDYDCLPPSDMQDDDLIGNITAAQVEAAQTSSKATLPLFIRLAKSLSLRTDVCRLVNGINLTADYGQVLKLDAELKTFLGQVATAIHQEANHCKRILLTILIRRATIALHAPFVTRTLQDPRYLYSRQVCVEMSTTILTEALSMINESGVFATINNVCRCEISNSVFLVCHELLTRAVERRRRLAFVLPQSGSQEQVLVDLVERTAQATTAICKPDIVSQRTCAWMQLSAELSKAAAGDEAMTATSMKEAIERSIQAYRASIQQTAPDKARGSCVVDDSYLHWTNLFENTVDEDYFNMFLNINNFEDIDPWI